ncbi:YbaB/EbfC family nucleoid-associated protein [Nocardia sp. NPDC058176]|uniref:YbaB/EbfC family nucleoid-associated protein n=1 Tax=Nocardia sp. NPDC058176 TaxID=3346368 RepID=UPI0036DB4619
MGDIDPVSGHIERLQRALTDARGTATSADGSLRVEVGANGALHRIELGADGVDRDPHRMVAMIVELHREAMADAAAVMREAVAALGSDPRLQEGRQEVADKLSRPQSASGTELSPLATGEADSPVVARSSPDQQHSAPGPAEAPTPTRLPPSRSARPTSGSAELPTKAPRRPTPARISECDPISFAPVTRTRRAPEQHPGDPGRTQPDPPREAAERAPASALPRPVTDDSAEPLPQPEPPVDTEPTESVIAWGDPADDSVIPHDTWPDDYLIMSDEWWGFPSTDGN